MIRSGDIYLFLNQVSGDFILTNGEDGKDQAYL